MAVYWLDPYMQTSGGPIHGTAITYNSGTRNGTYSNPFMWSDVVTSNRVSSINGIALVNGDELRIKGLPLADFFVDTGVWNIENHSSYSYGTSKRLTKFGSFTPSSYNGYNLSSNSSTFLNRIIGRIKKTSGVGARMARALTRGGEMIVPFLGSTSSNSSTLYMGAGNPGYDTAYLPWSSFANASNTTLEVEYLNTNKIINPNTYGGASYLSNMYVLNFSVDIKVTDGWTSSTVRNGYNMLFWTYNNTSTPNIYVFETNTSSTSGTFADCPNTYMGYMCSVPQNWNYASHQVYLGMPRSSGTNGAGNTASLGGFIFMDHYGGMAFISGFNFVSGNTPNVEIKYYYGGGYGGSPQFQIGNTGSVTFKLPDMFLHPQNGSPYIYSNSSTNSYVTANSSLEFGSIIYNHSNSSLPLVSLGSMFHPWVFSNNGHYWNNYNPNLFSGSRTVQTGTTFTTVFNASDYLNANCGFANPGTTMSYNSSSWGPQFAGRINKIGGSFDTQLVDFYPTSWLNTFSIYLYHYTTQSDWTVGFGHQGFNFASFKANNASGSNYLTTSHLLRVESNFRNAGTDIPGYNWTGISSFPTPVNINTFINSTTNTYDQRPLGLMASKWNSTNPMYPCVYFNDSSNNNALTIIGNGNESTSTVNTLSFPVTLPSNYTSGQTISFAIDVQATAGFSSLLYAAVHYQGTSSLSRTMFTGLNGLSASSVTTKTTYYANIAASSFHVDKPRQAIISFDCQNPGLPTRKIIIHDIRATAV